MQKHFSCAYSHKSYDIVSLFHAIIQSTEWTSWQKCFSKDMVKKCNVLGVQMLVIWNISSRLLWFAEMHFGYLNTSSVFKYLEKSFKKVHFSYNSCYGIRMWITVTVVKSFRIPGLMIQIKSFQLIFIRHWNESKFKKAWSSSLPLSVMWGCTLYNPQKIC